MIATNKETGKVAWEANLADGQVDLQLTAAPLVVKDKIIIGAAGGDRGVRDFIAALDGATGKVVWRKYVIPAPGEPGSETWKDKNNAWQTGGGAMSGVAERDQDIAESLDDVVRHLWWHGVPAEVLVVKANGHTVAELLTSAAQACTTSLMVLGAYGHSRMREALFGGSTQSFIRYADRPVLLMH
jgi:nucleotide-binding universal stress UspA family protein